MYKKYLSIGYTYSKVNAMPNLFYDLPEGLQYEILKKVSNDTWINDIVYKHKFLWSAPSDRLIELCKDVGTIQQGHHELDDMIDDCNMWAYKLCTNMKCDNCQFTGFPCANLSTYGFENERISGIWQPNF